MKVCSKCGEMKPLEAFGNEKRTKDGKRAECKDCYKRMRETWLLKNPDYFKNWHENKPTYRREVYQRNIELERERNKRWRNSNHEKTRWKTQKRRATLKDLNHDFILTQWDECKKFFGNVCAYCGQPANLQQEHFNPVSKGGHYTKSNIIPACPTCNASKKDRSFFEWYPKSQNYDEQRKNKILNYLGFYTDEASNLHSPR